MKLKFKNLDKLVRYRNAKLRARHRLASNMLMTANTSSEDVNDLGVNNFWKAGNFNSWSMQRATTQNPQSWTE